MTPNPNPSPEVREAWQEIGSAPLDGTVVDLWRTAPDGIHGRRVPDCRWDSNRSFNGGIGRVALPDAWVYSQGGEVHVDGGKLTHWRHVPEAPDAALSPQTLPAPGEVEYIDRAKLKQATDDLIIAVRSSWGIGSVEHNLVRDICDLIGRAPGVSLATVAAANDEGVARKWFPHLCWAGEPMHEGQFREPWPMDEERTALAKTIFDGWYEGNEDWDSPYNNVIQQRAFFAADAAIRLLSQGGGKS